MNYQMNPSSNFRGQRVIIVGGTSGIGLAVARAVGEAGGEPFVASRSAEKVRDVVARLGGRTGGEALDVTDEAAVGRFFAAREEFDHLVLSVGEVISVAPFLETTTADARRVFDVKFWGQYLCARHGAPHLRPGGSITLTSGVSSHRPAGGDSTLASVDGALESLCRALAHELAPVRVNAVSPGLVVSDTWGGLGEEARAELYRGSGQRLPVRFVARPEDVARTYLHLLTSAYTTGQVLTVDGGLSVA